MFNTLFATITLLLTAGALYYRHTRARTTTHHALDPHLPIRPETTIVVFDIHGVLFNADYKNIVRTFLKSPHKYRFMLHAMYPAVWIDFIRLWCNNAVFGKYVAHLTTRYPSLQPCIPLMTDLANTQTPIPETIALIQKLHADGYTLHIFSNIGMPVMEDLAQKFPAIFAHFHAIKTPSVHNNFTGKPNPAIFNEYMQEHNDSSKQILFIDDKLKNLETAKKFGIIGIYFDNPDTLKDQLVSWGMCVPK